jgi:predicted hydrolase (HD superfamily)
MKVSSIVKKIKDKAFARGVDREQLKNCEMFL